MRLRGRLSLAAVGGIGFGLAGVIVFDVYTDWMLEGKTLASTVAENAIPFVLALVLPVAAWRLGRLDLSDRFRASVAKWTLAGTAAMLAVSSVVVGFQVVQGELKPWLIVFQTTVVGAVAGLVVGHNTARLRRTRNEAETERRRWASLFENDPAGIVDLHVVDDALLVEATNERFDELTGADHETVVGEPFTDTLGLFAPAEPAELREYIERGEPYDTETGQWTADGRRDFQVRVVPYGEKRAFVIYQDVTDLAEAKRDLEHTVEKLEHSNEQLQQFAYVASHDLQEPLRMVSSYVDLLESEYGGELDDEADEYIEFAVDGAERMQNMIDALLQYSRVETRAEPLAETDAAEVFEGVRRDLALLVDEHDATIEVGDLPRVRADGNQLGQVFQNLVKNAIEHADGDTSPTVEVTAEEREDEVVFAVSDDGPGIPGDQHERIFDIFEQGAREDEGTGIGLAVCRRIVERHDGDIWVESTPGEGATFRFTVPKVSTQQRASAPEDA